MWDPLDSCNDLRRLVCTPDRPESQPLTLSPSSYVLGIDVDAPALATARENLAEVELENELDFIMADVAELNNESSLLDRLKSGVSSGERRYLLLKLRPLNG